MSDQLKIPTFRSLDIYRHVVVHCQKQLDVAQSFGVTPVRICQVVRRVRQWVDLCLGDWLFPGRHDLRFCAALQSEQIRIEEFADDPETVRIIGPSITYTRAHHPATTSTTNSVSDLSTEPINSASSPSQGPIGATPSAHGDYIDPVIRDLGLTLAQLLMDWKKSRSITSAFKNPAWPSR